MAQTAARHAQLNPFLVSLGHVWLRAEIVAFLWSILAKQSAGSVLRFEGRTGDNVSEASLESKQALVMSFTSLITMLWSMMQAL
jgi:hypothetical protein